MGDAAELAWSIETGGDCGDLYPKPRKFTKCPKCGKKMKKAAGLSDHLRDVHGVKPTIEDNDK